MKNKNILMKANPIEEFIQDRQQRIRGNGTNADLKKAAALFNLESNKAQYSYNFSWMGRPIIQYPQDMIAMQELIWQIRPDWVIETGIAHGGSLIYYASLLELIGSGRVLGIDIDIREHNRKEIEAHPMFRRISMIQGSSVDQAIVDQVSRTIQGGERIVVCLDSNHTHEHVFRELQLYADFVSVDSYLVVFDTIVDDLPDGYLPGRKWGKGNNPKSAVEQFLAQNDQFVVDEDIDKKLLLSVAPGGYLRRVK